MKKIVLLMVAMVALTMFGCENNNAVEVNEGNNDVVIESNNDNANETDESNENDQAATDESNENNQTATDESADATEEVVEEEETSEEGTTDLDLEAIITQTYEASGLELPRTMFAPLTKENQAYMVGTDSFDFLEGVVSEPMMSSVAHSFVMFTVEEGSDIEAIKEAVRSNVDVRKWICVSVEPEQVVVENFGNVIVLIMEERSDVFYSALEEIMNK